MNELYRWLIVLVGCLHWGGTERVETLHATHGHIFKNMLHSERPNASNITWTATVLEGAALPPWLRVIYSRHSGIAYLFGVPDSDTQANYNIIVIARSEKTFDIRKKMFRLQVSRDPLGLIGTGAVRQLAEVWLVNGDLASLIGDDGRLSHLARVTRQAFGGDFTGAYIRRLQHAHLPSRPDKKGIIMTIATKSRFPVAVHNFARSVLLNPYTCKTARDSLDLAKEFSRNNYEVDWCKFKLTDLMKRRALYGGTLSAGSGVDAFQQRNRSVSLASAGERAKFEPYVKKQLKREYFSDWIMVLPIPGVVLVFLLLVLSLIFFGHREGQRWRDYKTPATQLREYVQLRRGQHKLRDLTHQRQSFARADDTGIRAFLVPKSTSNRMMPIAQDSPPPYAGSVGKQTVAEAAATRGNDIEPYMDSAAIVEMDEQRRDSDQDTLLNEGEMAVALGGQVGLASSPTPPTRKNRK